MFFTIFYTFMSAFALLFAIYHFSGIRHLYQKTAHFNGPLSFPLIGCTYLFLGGPEHVLKQVMKLAKYYTSPFRFSYGTRVWLFTKDPEQIKITLCSDKTAEKDNLYRMFAAGGKGLVTAENKISRVHRKLLQPSFAQQILKSFVSIFQKNSLYLSQAIEGRVGGPEFNIYSHLSRALFSNICESSMGVTFDKDEEGIEKYIFALRRALELILERFIRVWLHIDTLFSLSQIGKETHECVNYLYSFIENVIEVRMKSVQCASIENKGFSVRRTRTTLDLMLELKDDEKKFTLEEIRDHVFTFISAGYDSTSRTLNFILLMLATHPDVQDKVYKEMFNIYGDEDPEKVPVKSEDLQHLKYLERVIKETMRLFPAVPVIGREATEDFELDGKPVPKGCGIAVFILGLHRDEKIWPDPLKFDPDRFLPQAVNERHSCAFVPFSFGSRDCLGRVYAMMLIKVVVATLLRKYVVIKDKIKPVEDIKIKIDLLLQTVEPINLRIEKRKK